MDLQLTDEQTWLAESLETLLERDPDGVWERLVEFGALDVGGEEGLGAVELCLIARGLGAHLASTPYLGSAALRYAAPSLLDAGESVAIALLEPGGGWSVDAVQAELVDGVLRRRKVAVEHGGAVDRLAVVALVDGEPGVVLVSGAEATPQPPFDPTVPMAAVELDGVAREAVPSRETAARVSVVGGLLASAEAVGAAGRILEDARAYASERRQFGRTIGSNQALRHLLADMYVRHASSWSTVLYAAAALDDGLDDPELTASVAKAYVARAAREVAHGAMQVFGGIAFTEEHQAHRFLRRIVVREQQFGDAAHHERELGRRLARAASPASVR